MTLLDLIETVRKYRKKTGKDFVLSIRIDSVPEKDFLELTDWSDEYRLTSLGSDSEGVESLFRKFETVYGEGDEF